MSCFHNFEEVEVVGKNNLLRKRRERKIMNDDEYIEYDGDTKKKWEILFLLLLRKVVFVLRMCCVFCEI